MHPILLKIGPVPIHTYGFLIAIGFLCALAVIKRLSARAGLNVDRMLDLTFWSLLIGMAGSRLLYVITRLDYFIQDPIAVFKIWEGGLVFFGGLLGGLSFIAWYVRKHQIPIWRAWDVLAPGLVIGQAFGRMGCLAAGCCYGKPTGSDYGIKFYSDLVEKNFHGIPLHPTQLYESTSMFLLFGCMMWLSRRKAFDGQVGLTYLMAYPVIRSVIEVFRGDLIRGFVIEDLLSTSQFISILIFTAATAMLVYRLKTLKKAKA